MPHSAHCGLFRNVTVYVRVSCACLAFCSDACFALWESKHKGSLRGSARVLAAMVQQPQLLRPLQQQPDAAGAFRELLAALPARHRAHLTTGKGWQVSAALFSWLA